MKNKLYIYITSIFFIFIFIIFFLGLKKSNIYVPNENTNITLENFESTDFFNGDKIFINNILSKDEYYLINIWASWCLPCRSEHPYLIKLKNVKSLKLIGINYRDKKENASKFLKEFRNPFDKILTDQDGTISIVLGAYGVPESFLVKNNKIVKKIIGPIDQKKYLDTLKLINE